MSVASSDIRSAAVGNSRISAIQQFDPVLHRTVRLGFQMQLAADIGRYDPFARLFDKEYPVKALSLFGSIARS